MNFKEFAVGTQYETHTLVAGYFTAKIRKGKFVYYIDFACTCPWGVAKIDLPKEPLTAQTLGQAKYKVAQIFKEFTQANAKKQAELAGVWGEMNKQARSKNENRFN